MLKDTDDGTITDRESWMVHAATVQAGALS
jgi:hypothetical protein